MQERTTTNRYPWSKEARHFGILWGTEVGQLFSWIFINDTETGDAEAGVVASAVGAVIGILVIVGQSIYRRIKKTKKSSLKNSYSLVQEPPILPDDPNNVMHNRVKAGATFGAGIGCMIGAVIGTIVPLPAEKIFMMMGSAIGGTLGGLIAIIIPWWNPSDIESKPQANPVSERIRTGAMLGSCFGIVFGAFVLGSIFPFSIPLCILLATGFGIVLFSIAAYYLDESFLEEKHNASNPWSKRIRAGVQWGACLGILVGIILPGLGIGLNAALSVGVGGALFSIGGAIIAVAIEPLITKIITFIWGKDYETANPWGPRARCGSFYGTWIGMLIGCCIFPGFIGATLGGAIGGIVGGAIAVAVEPIYIAFTSLVNNKSYVETVKIEKLESCSSGNSWSERCRTGAQIGAALGGLIGFFAFPPYGMFLGAAIGGILGGAIAFLIPAEWNHKDDVPDGPQSYQSAPLPLINADGKGIRDFWNQPQQSLSDSLNFSPTPQTLSDKNQIGYRVSLEQY